VGENPQSDPKTGSAAWKLAKFRGAFALHERGRLAEADVLYCELLAEDPDHVDGLHFRGVLLHQAGKHPAALDLIGKAVELDPANAAAHSNLGVVLYALGRFEDSVRSCDLALRLVPGHSATHTNRGNALRALKRLSDALESYDRALYFQGQSAQVHLHRGNTWAELRQFEEALASYDQALAIDPCCAEALSDRGGVLVELCRFDDALSSLDRALALKPDIIAALSNRGAALIELKRQGEALASLDRALHLDPDSVGTLFNRGTALRDLKRPAEAAQSYAHLLEVDPFYPYARGYEFNSRMHACDWVRYSETGREIERQVAAGGRVDAPFSFFAVSGCSAHQLQCAQTWAADKYPVDPNPIWSGERYGHHRVRIAYLSTDFAEHPVAHSIVELIETHDRSRFEVLGVSFGLDVESQTRARLKAGFDRFIDARSMSSRQVAQRLRDMEVDIAVDLNGYTQGHRAGVFALRGAPVQASYLGFSGTMGTGCIDYVIGDRHVIPSGAEPFYSEKVVRLPDTYMCSDRKRAVGGRVPSRAEAGLPQEGFVFCCFNSSFKIAPPVFEVWMRLLARVRGSVLWLFEESPDATRNLRKEAESRGVAAHRLVFARRLPSLEDHLARYALVDLFVDTLPYNAHVTARDALWAGVPVLTCMGSTFVGRVAGSLLHAVGMPELVTGDLADYEALALRLSSTPGLLADLRTRLACNRASHPLFDTARFTRNIENAYLRMRRQSDAGLAPEAFDIQPWDAEPSASLAS